MAIFIDSDVLDPFDTYDCFRESFMERGYFVDINLVRQAKELVKDNEALVIIVDSVARAISNDSRELELKPIKVYREEAYWRILGALAEKYESGQRT